MMLEWLKSERPRMTVDQLRTEVEKIGRADALLVLDGYLFNLRGTCHYITHCTVASPRGTLNRVL